MSLAPRSFLGPYQVIEQLGAGGMGEVYRARDTKLNRDVALKVLLAAVATDPDRLARFRREAQVLASLNHPHIAHIHGLDDSTATPALVMELVEGPTLADMLQASGGGTSAIPIGEALAIARQIADALDAAHEKEIVHRDLKPANIKVRPDGTVKVLDFGLAKALSADAPAGGTGVYDSPTVASPARTIEGVVMGTAGYMSPEQARGRTVDRRTDIWAFGCVLYEMLTGVPAFSGDTTTDILAAVIQRDPDWSRLPSATPSRIVSLLRRSLQRNPKDRLRDIADARFEIEDALHQPTPTIAPPTTHSGDTARTAPPPASSTPRRLLAPALALLLGAAAAGGAVWWLTAERTSPTAPPAAVRAIITLPANTTLALDRGSAIALSPDGRRLAFTGRSGDHVQLYVRALEAFDALPIAGTDGAVNPFFSPDGQWLGFFAGGKLKKVSLDGGAPVALTDARTPRGEAWGPNNAMLVAPTNGSPIMQLSALGGDTAAVTSLDKGELGHRWPRFFPDGRHIVFTVWNDTGWEPSRVAVQTPGESTHKVIVPAGGGYARLLGDGPASVLVYARSEGLMAAKFDATKQEIVGQTLPVVDGLLTNLSGGAHYDVSANGTLAYVTGSTSEQEYAKDLTWVSVDGKTRTPALRVANMGRLFELSPDGTRVASINATGSAARDVWIDDLQRGTHTRLTTESDNFENIWSADGKWVAFGRGTPVQNLFRRAADGTDREERLTTSALAQAPESFSPDGRFLVFTQFDPLTGADLWILTVPAPGSTAPADTRAFLNTRFTEAAARFSPDGKWIAYQSNESGRFEVYVRPFPEGVRKFAVSTEGGLMPRWSPDGRTIYFRSTSNQMMAAAVQAGTDFSVAPAKVLFDARDFDNIYAVAPDGKRFLMIPALSTENSPTQIHLVLHWLDEIRQRLK